MTPNYSDAERPRLVLADDHPLIVEGLRRVLEPEFEVVAAVSNGRDLLAVAADLEPDAVLLDIGMPVLNGIEAARQLKATSPKTRIVFVTQMEGREYVRGAFQAGASAYISKQAVTTELVPALHAALAGAVYISPSLRGGKFDEWLTAGKDPADFFGEGLTPRQREVLQLVAEGKTGKEIALSLSISTRTVEFHKAALMATLGLRTTAELTRYALEHGIA